MDEPIVVRFCWTNADLKAADLCLFRSQVRPVYRAGLYLLCVLYGCVAIALAMRGGVSGSLLTGLFWMVVSVLLYARVWHPSPLNSPEAGGETLWHISSAHLEVASPRGRAEIPWSSLVQVNHMPAGFLLIEFDNRRHWLPAHGFANEADIVRFTSLARDRVEGFREVR